MFAISCMSYLYMLFTISMPCMSYLYMMFTIFISCMAYLHVHFPYHVCHIYIALSIYHIHTLSTCSLITFFSFFSFYFSLLTLSQNIQPSDDLLTTRYQRYIRQYKHQERFIGGMLRINAVSGLQDTCYCHVTSDMKPSVHVTTDVPIGIPAPSVDRVCGHCETRVSPMWWPSTNESGAFMCQACRWASKGDEMDIS